MSNVLAITTSMRCEGRQKKRDVFVVTVAVDEGSGSRILNELDVSWGELVTGRRLQSAL